MQFPFKLLWLVLSVTLPESVAADNPQRSYKAKRLPDFDKRHTFWKAHARPNILFILTDDQGICPNSLTSVQKLTLLSRLAYELT